MVFKCESEAELGIARVFIQMYQYELYVYNPEFIVNNVIMLEKAKEMPIVYFMK